jgi:uncharacterized membrane protein
MFWKSTNGIKSELKSSLWIIPLIAIPLELLATRIVHYLDGQLGWTFLGLAVSGAQAMYQAIVSAILSFLVFTFGSLLVAIQVASSQLTPRIISTTLLSDKTVKFSVALFIFTLMFALSAQNRLDKNVNELVAFVAASLGILCFATFFFLIDHASRLLRPISVLSQVGSEGINVIRSVYSEPSQGPAVEEGRLKSLGSPDARVSHEGRSSIVVAVDLPALMAEANRRDVVIEFAPQVGDFVAIDEPLFYVYGKAAFDEQVLRDAVLFGSERTMEQDPTFAFRIVVDIALRALSPAINDPTTAVLAIDQLHRMLRTVGMQHLSSDERLDAGGRLRVICRTPNWEDFVKLSFSEIRGCGSGNLQVVRRLRSMVVNLTETLPAHRVSAITQELALIDREIERNFIYPEDLALARIPDPQGLGGRSGLIEPLSTSHSLVVTSDAGGSPPKQG